MKLLILDLDETLLYGSEQPLNREPDFVAGPYSIYKRPGVEAFLQEMSSIFELAVWTASTPSYAKEVVPEIVPASINLSFVWARDRCTLSFDRNTHSHEWMKNLGKVKRRGYNLENVVMLDDTPRKLANHYGNLLPIRPFEGDESDTELSLISQFLRELAQVPNVRKVEKRFWRDATKQP